MKNDPQRKQNKMIKIIICVVCVIVAALLIFAIISGINALNEYNKKSTIKGETVEETGENENNGSGPPQILLPHNNYKPNGFITTDAIKTYDDDNYSGVAGIDVSSYQQNIDWELVKDTGIEFAIIRVGYRGWSSGKLDQDDCFVQHIEGALAAGLDVGVYFFSQALTPEEAAEEAEYTLSLITDYDISGPVVFDWEEVEAHDARTNEMNMLMLTSCADAFCQVVEQAGYEAGVYFNQAYGYEQFNLSSLKDYTFWLAEYDETPSFVYDFQIWQYTNEGEVPGIEGNVDLNIMFKKK